jgi:hypothetical protein
LEISAPTAFNRSLRRTSASDTTANKEINTCDDPNYEMRIVE